MQFEIVWKISVPPLIKVESLHVAMAEPGVVLTDKSIGTLICMVVPAVTLRIKLEFKLLLCRKYGKLIDTQFINSVAGASVQVNVSAHC